MKIKVLLNKIKVDVKDDFEKARDYFKRHGLDIEWEFQESDIKKEDIEPIIKDHELRLRRLEIWGFTAIGILLALQFYFNFLR